ncbi:MAG: hypothetical protein V1735_06710 [Nanoarchaeota archaeon]
MEREIKSIKRRNERVELEKAWETSLARRIAIAVLTYLVVVAFLWAAHISQPFLNAIVPAVAFFLSTLTIPFFKKIWMKGR